jgi:hypothetical protein
MARIAALKPRQPPALPCPLDVRPFGESLKAALVPEYSLYRWYLAGGVQAFRLRWTGVGVVFGLGLLVRWAGLSTTRPGLLELVDLPLTALAGVLVAVFIAHWLGARRGLLAGIGIAVSVWSLSACGLLERLAVETLWIGLAAFALANVPGRQARVEGPWVRAVFWGAMAASLTVTGLVGPCYLLAICCLYLVAAQDSRGGRFLLDRRGLAFLGLVIACLATARHFGLAQWLPPTAADRGGASWGVQATALVAACLPWIPLTLPGLVQVLHQGHCFLPFWRLLACWTVVPLVLVGGGLFRAHAHLAVLLLPLAALAAVSLDGIMHGLRRGEWFRCRAT